MDYTSLHLYYFRPKRKPRKIANNYLVKE